MVTCHRCLVAALDSFVSTPHPSPSILQTFAEGPGSLGAQPASRGAGGAPGERRPPNESVEWVLATRLRLLVVSSMPALFRKPKVPFFIPGDIVFSRPRPQAELYYLEAENPRQPRCVRTWPSALA